MAAREEKKKRPVQARLNIRRAVIVLATTGWAQIILVLALGLMFVTGSDLPAGILLFLLAGLVVFGNVLLMKRALSILNAEREMADVEQTLESAEELNHRLRTQRHDFMNHLQVVYGLMELGEYKDACQYIDRVYKDIQSVSKLMRTDNAAVNALLAAKAEEAEQHSIAFEFDIRSRASGLEIEPWELCGIFGNILDNAMDALEGEPGAKIRIALWEELDGFHFAIENNGPPIPEGILEQVFEPGFTTKGENGQGLGLHIVRQTLEERGGAIEVRQDGGWTSFIGRLPRAVKAGG